MTMRALTTSLLLLALPTAALAQNARKEAHPAEKEAPFDDDYTWMNGQSRQTDFPLKFSKYVTFSAYLDGYYALSSNHPKDHTLTGGASATRSNEFQINLASVGTELSYKNVTGRLALQFGNMLSVVQDLDGTTARGRSLSTSNLRYIREMQLGYHFDVGYGLNVDAGIFMSYIGLESYLLAENWNYTRSFVCEHTPFYFQGLRVQYFPLKNVKIEPWLMNGWQTYGKWNELPSVGAAIRWSPYESLSFMANFYLGTDTKDQPSRVRFHSDHSVVGRYYHAPDSRVLDSLAVSLNSHYGFETGGGGPGPGDAYVIGTSLAHRATFWRNHFALALRGEFFSNPSRYLAQYPPPGFAIGPGQSLKIVGLTTTFEVMPTSFMSVRAEFNYRHSDSGYFAGPQGTTTADGFQGTGPAIADTRKDQALYVLAANFRL